MDSARANDTAWRSEAGTPSASNGPSSTCATAGSPTAPRPSEHTVMPNCVEATQSSRCSLANLTAGAPRLNWRYVNRTLTDAPLLPWPMESRVLAELGISVGAIWDKYAGGQP